MLITYTTNFTLVKLTKKYQQSNTQYTADKVTAKQVKFETRLSVRDAHAIFKKYT